MRRFAHQSECGTDFAKVGRSASCRPVEVQLLALQKSIGNRALSAQLNKNPTSRQDTSDLNGAVIQRACCESCADGNQCENSEEAPPQPIPVQALDVNSVAPVLVLQRQAANHPSSSDLLSPPKRPDTIIVQRDDDAEEPAGCGFCIDPGPAGTQAHNQIQARMGKLGIDSEVATAAGVGRGGRGRLDLARWNDKVIEIGEIKPDHATGLANGVADLTYYKGALEKSKDPKFKDKEVRMLQDAGPAPMVFDNPGVALPEQQMLETRNVNGVFGYKCLPPNWLYFTAAGQLSPHDKKVPREVLKAKRDFFNSDCIKKKTKRQPVEEERVRILDRAGARRLVKVSMAISLLQSRFFHVNQQLQLLSGEHHQRRNMAAQQVLLGSKWGPFATAAAAYDLATMPSLDIWTAAQAAAKMCEGAKELTPLVQGLDALDKAFAEARYTYLTYRGDKAVAADTPATAAGASAPSPAAPPVPAKSAAGHTPASTTAPPAEGGIDPVKVAAIAAVVLLTLLILQPELGVATVAAAGAETAGAGAGVATAAGMEAAGGVLMGEAATAAEAGLELAAEYVATEPVLGAAAM
ncbi:hypothetical protein [Mycobacterium sp. HM-7]